MAMIKFLLCLCLSSIWFQPSSSANGALVAKSMESGIIYSLSLVSDDSNFLVRLSYRQSVTGQVLGVGTAEVSVVKSSLTDGSWHSLVVIVTGDRALFYTDNIFIDSRYKIKMYHTNSVTLILILFAEGNPFFTQKPHLILSRVGLTSL